MLIQRTDMFIGRRTAAWAVDMVRESQSKSRARARGVCVSNQDHSAPQLFVPFRGRIIRATKSHNPMLI